MINRRCARLMTMIAASVVVSAACGASDDTGADAGGADERPTSVAGSETDERLQSKEPVDGGDAADSADTRAGATQSLPNGFDITYLGWSPWPFVDAPDDAAFTNINDDEPPMGVRIEVCAAADAGESYSAEFAFAAGDAAGEPIVTALRSVTTGPIVSPTLLVWPAPGACSEGWVQPNVTIGVRPETVLWIMDFDDSMPVLSWPIGDPYIGSEHPVDGEVLALGQPFTVANNATWTVYGVERVPAADPAALVPEGSSSNAGMPYDQPPAGYEWAAVDAEYCFGDDTSIISEGLGLAVDGWATQLALSANVNVGPDHLALFDGEQPCLRKNWYAPVAPDATITAITSTFGAGPWWLVP
jgi:hypothetical protein